jgi:hypothetical protein
LGYVDENILQPFKWVFGRLKNNLDEKLSSLGEFFDKILAPFQRAIRAFKEADGGLTGFGKVTAAIDAFGDSNYFGEETAAPNNVTNAMSGNSDTRTEKGEVLQQALLDKSARDAGSTPSVSVVSQDNSVRQNSQTTRSENVILVDPETAQVQAASP